jgi:hypothetical protein
MTRLQARVLVIGLVVMIAIGIALFGGYIPGLKPNYSAPDIRLVDGHRYYALVTPLHYPGFTNISAPWNVSFRNVTFELQCVNWYSSTGGIVVATGTESNGTHYAFVMGQTLPNGTRSTLYLSPDRVFGASYPGGWFGGIAITLLVATSYLPNGSVASASSTGVR